MYSKEEAAKLRQQFWISFGQYMKPVPSASGLPVNWINYKTGVKHLFFKMDVDQKSAFVAIQFEHPDPEIRHLFFEQMEEFKLLFSNTVSGEWDWNLDHTNAYGKTVSQVSCSLANVNVYNQQDWPKLISFFKQQIILLDEFWDSVKPVFENLA